jgi:DNA-binding winged helix-turn-helix (wHTH) protein/tetratricopeptide (TPR) repeat protein
MPYKLDHLLLNPEALTLTDTETNQLVSQDEKLIAALTLLASRYPNTVTKDELMEAIWPKQILTEWSLTRFIADARKLLGPRHHIKTVHGRGYRYLFPVEEIKHGEPPAQSSTTTEVNHYPVSTSIPKGKIHPSVIYSLCFLVTGFFLLIFYLTKPSFLLPKDVTDPVVAILPANIENGHPAWRLGVPALIAKRLSGFSIATSHSGLVNKQFENWRDQHPDQYLDSKDVKKFCAEIGCNQLVLIHQESDLDHTQMYYQIITPYNNKISTTFTGGNLHEALQFLWDDFKTQFVKKESDEFKESGVIFELELKNSFITETYTEALGSLVADDAPPARMLLGYLQEKHPEFSMANLELISLYSSDIETSKAILQKTEPQNKYELFIVNILQTQIHLKQSNYDQAIKYAAEALSISSSLGSEHLTAVGLINMGISRMALSQSALDDFKKAEAIFSTRDDPYSLAITHLCLADAFDTNRESQKANRLRNDSKLFFEKFHLANSMSCNVQSLLFY